MNDPLNTRWDLMPGHSIPYTDDPDGYNPTDALVVYSLPKLDPTVNNSNAPQDQSAALLDPSTFAPPADIGILGPVTPPGAVAVTTRDGSFLAPIGTNFHNEYRAGQYIGAEPIVEQFGDIGNALGHGGTFDYQRADGHFNPDYRDASNYGVGVLMQGAGHSLPATDVISTLYALTRGRPDTILHDWPLWGEGYDAAADGQLLKGEGR